MASSILLAAAYLPLVPSLGQARDRGRTTATTAVVSLCNVAYPKQKRETFRTRLGTKTLWNKSASRAEVCSGAFGLPADVHLTLEAKCDLVAASYNLVNPADSFMSNTGCFTVSALTEGVSSAAKGAVCGYLADTLAVGAGLFAAGATLQPELGVAVWKGVSFFGDTAVCVGLGDGAAKKWGEKLEADHEVHVARDLISRNKCLQYTQRKWLGEHWSAVACPAGFAENPPPPRPAMRLCWVETTGVPSDPNYQGYALIVDELHVHGISCDQGRNLAVNFSYNQSLPAGWECSNSAPASCVDGSGTKRVTFAFGGDAG